jgi:alpha-ketoglutarate-dependent taurine dioxygenase
MRPRTDDSRRSVCLNKDFGVSLENVTRADLRDPDFRQEAETLWIERRRLLAVRGDELSELTPDELTDWASVFGDIDNERLSARDFCTVTGHPIIRLGNVADDDRNPRAMFADMPVLTDDSDVQYNSTTQRPVWHTDSTFRATPPIGSVFHCKLAPPHGGDTLFADTRGALAALDEATRLHLGKLEAVCSLAHHDKKVNLYSPTYPTLNTEQRAANPPNRVPIVLQHPISGQPALYGMNSSTCAVVQKGMTVSDERMDVFDLEGIEGESVGILRNLLPHATGPKFTVRWRWHPGDVVVWDNRCTMHAATGFDPDSHEREMWRMTLVERAVGDVRPRVCFMPPRTCHQVRSPIGRSYTSTYHAMPVVNT